LNGLIPLLRIVVFIDLLFNRLKRGRDSFLVVEEFEDMETKIRSDDSTHLSHFQTEDRLFQKG